MAKSINKDYETYNDLQILCVDPTTMYFISTEMLRQYNVQGMSYKDKGEVYLYQTPPENEDDDKARRDFYSKFAEHEGMDMPPFDELAEFDGLIPVKVEYKLGVDSDGKTVMKFGKSTQLSLDDQLTIDDNGDCVRASLFD